MPGEILTTASTIQCPHGGRAVLLTSNSKAQAGGVPALLESDIHPVAGCPFTVGIVYRPCVRIEWSAGATKASVNGINVLVRSSIGKCYSAENAVQGVAIIASMQTQVSAQ